ncbi:MAG: C/D box methylation guide ribonucleoprotein complex aNOP56 subunit [Candidatus Njordarchaeales archaeon]
MWLLVTYPGIFAISEGLKDIIFRPFGDDKPDVERAFKAILSLEKRQTIDELKDVIEKIGKVSLKTDNEFLVDIIKSEYPDIPVQMVMEGDEILKIRDKIREYLEELFGGYEKYVEFVNKVSIELAKEKLQEAGERRDLMIIRAVTISEDLTKMINTLVSHVREWYGYYWPELGKVVEDHPLYLRLIAELGSVENFTEENLRKIVKSEKLIREILKAKEERVGIRVTEEDIRMMQEVARRALDLYDQKARILQYLDNLMKETAPNIRALVGSVIGAKLIRKAGGLAELAKMPASTIQILGAEKALFRALQGRGTPPKHGIIFQDPRIFRAPWWQRGKIARALAGKLAIAARVDYFSGEYIGDELLAELERRIEEIKKKYPKPPTVKKRGPPGKPGKPRKKPKRKRGKK